MNSCEHKFGLKRRNNELYCPVCRGVIYKDDLDSKLNRGVGWWVPPKGKKNE